MFLIKKIEDDQELICFYCDTNKIEDMGMIRYDKMTECFSMIAPDKENTEYVFHASATKLTYYIMNGLEIPEQIVWATH